MFIKSLVLLALTVPSVYANKFIQSKIEQHKTVMNLIHPAAEKSANNPYAPAYLLNLNINDLVTDMNVLSQFPGVDISTNYWSGYYWPNYVGGLGFRYNDRYFPKGKYGKSRAYIQKKPSSIIPNELLSPSEKYDIVMGISPEEPGSLTKRQWSLAAKEFSETRKVETWQGICNGWAAASINFPSPKKTVTIPSYRGDITFEPEDIKALGSLLYAQGHFESAFNGFRCDTDEPDTRDGRVITPECFDVNPADWHLIVTQQVGMKKKPFIIDYVNSKEVWNKPVVGYSLRYFDIKKRSRVTDNYREVIRPNKKVNIYRRFRNPETVSLLGVHMKTKLLFGANEDSRVSQTFKTVEYSYLLELDQAHRIIGGEWITEKHPDFAWIPRSYLLPSTDGDSMVLNLDPSRPIDNGAWRQAALTSIAHGAPLGSFVMTLFSMAQ